MVFTITLMTIVLVVLLYRLLTTSSKLFSSISPKSGWLIGLQLIGISLCQFFRIRNEEYNVDESTWIADAFPL